MLAIKHEKNEVKQIYYGLPAIFYVLAMLFSNAALRFISYPTQVIGKSSKPIAVMLLGILIGRKTYTIKKFAIVILIVFGVIVFSWKDKPSEKEINQQIIGMSLVLASLLMDGFMGGIQDRMRSVKKPTSLNLMHYLNAWSSLYLTALLIFTLEGLEFINFCMRHPEVIIDLSGVVLVGTIAQYFISDLVKCFGALPLSITLTVRKFITVFLSVMIYGNTLIMRQWIAAFIIFTALLMDALIQKGKDKNDDEKEEKHEQGTELKEQILEKTEESVEMLKR